MRNTCASAGRIRVARAVEAARHPAPAQAAVRGPSVPPASPGRGPLHLAQRIEKTDALGQVLVPGRPRADAQPVHAPDLDGVHLQRPGERVHLLLAREVHLRTSRPAHLAPVGVVRVHAVDVHLHVGRLVGARGVVGRALERGRVVPPVRHVRPLVEPDLHLNGGDASVLRRPGLRADERRVALGGGDHALLARIHELHGPAGGAGEDGCAQAHVEARLALSAERPAGGRLDETDRTLALKAQNPGDVLPHQEGLLGRTPYLDSAARVRARARRLHLQIEVIDGGRRVFVLDDDVRLPETLLDVPFPYLRLVEHVPAGEDDLRALFHRLARAGDDGQGPVFDPYQPRRRLGRLGRLRRDEGDHLARVAHPLMGDDGHGPVVGGDAGVVRQVVSREHGDDACDAQRLARVDRYDLGVRVFAAERLADQHPRKLEVVEVIRGARRLFGVVQKGKGLADHGAAHVFGFRHGTLLMRREPSK